MSEVTDRRDLSVCPVEQDDIADGARPIDGIAHQERRATFREAGREPTPAADGTATWSLSRLRGALRSAPDGLPKVATSTIWQVLHEAGLSYQRSRTWCPTGSALRRRVSGPAIVTDPDSESKKS